MIKTKVKCDHCWEHKLVKSEDIADNMDKLAKLGWKITEERTLCWSCGEEENG